jgi:hypothetical protein
MKWLPPLLAGIHAVVGIVVFSAAIVSPVRSGLLPNILVFMDWPVSFLLEYLRDVPGDYFQIGLRQQLLIDGIIYVILGSLWFYGIGVLVRTIYAKLRR